MAAFVIGMDFAATVNAATQDYTIRPSADAYVQERLSSPPVASEPGSTGRSSSSANFGDKKLLRCHRDATGDRQVSYIRFFLPEEFKSVTSAKLKLWVRSQSAAGVLDTHLDTHKVKYDHWIESGHTMVSIPGVIKWTNRPDIAEPAIASTPVTGTWGEVTIDVKHYVNKQLAAGDHAISLAFRAAEPGNNIEIHSRESHHSPQIVVETAQATNVPSGYTLAFYSNFDATNFQQHSESHQWWYELNGGEFGFNWQTMRGLTGDAKTKLRIQTLVARSATPDPTPFQLLMLPNLLDDKPADHKPDRGKVMKFENRQSSDSDKLSRVQLMSPVAGTNCFFIQYNVLWRSSLRDAMMNTANKSEWNDFMELHDIRHSADPSWLRRLSVFLQYDGEFTSRGIPKFYIRTRLQDDTNNRNVWSVESKSRSSGQYVFTGWDQWHKVQMLVEAGSSQSKVHVWIDGKNVCKRDVSGTAVLGDIVENIHPMKLYVSRRTQAAGMARGNPASCEFDRLKIYTK